MVMYYCKLLFGLIHRPYVFFFFFFTTTFQGMVLPSSSGETYSVGVRSIELACIGETLWFKKKHRTLDKVQITDRSI
jgi:hypothetical protein